MFSGIVEKMGKVKAIEKEVSNIHFTIQTDKIDELYIDQSISHNGVCLTIVSLHEDAYTVTAIEETLQRSNIGALQVGDHVNLERSMKPEMRLDGHMVQGHVDTMAEVVSVDDRDGSWIYAFKVAEEHKDLLVQKGSVAVNGVSLTVVDPSQGQFKVAIIPYTYEHTNFHTLQEGHKVNIEFDIIGKYVAKQLRAYLENQ